MFVHFLAESWMRSNTQLLVSLAQRHDSNETSVGEAKLISFYFN